MGKMYKVVAAPGRAGRIWVGSFLCSALFSVMQLSVFAAGSVILAWNPSEDPLVAGYNIYYGSASGAYTNTISAGNATNVTISGFVSGATYYFAATTYNTNGQESSFSSEVSCLAVTNQPPTLDAISPLSINENAGLQAVSLSCITCGATNENQTLAVTAVSANPGLIPNPTVNYTSPNPTGSLTFAPALNAFGTATISVTVNDGAAASNIVTRTFTVTVNPVNNPPTLNTIGDLSIKENAGLQTVSLSGISSGAANESQTLTITAVSGNTGVIPHPTVSYTNGSTTGKLTFTPVANANGTAVVTVTANDGGTSNNIVARTFTVTVNSVNNPPTLNAISSLTMNKNPGLQTVNLSGITSGAANENQTLVVSAMSSNPNLVPHPTVNYTSANTAGILTFTPELNAVGTAGITVTVNDGGASNNLVTQTFAVTIRDDPARPTNQITSPKASQQFTNGAVVVMTGKAGDNAAVKTVYYSLNGSGWLAAATANGWTNWTADLTLAPGTNTVQVYAVDTSGNVSTTSTVRYVYLVYRPLTVQIVGRGTVTPNYNGVQLAVNVNYTMKAVAQSGFVFTNWTGGLTTNGATVRFAMRTNLVLTANFVDAIRPTVSIVTPKANQQFTNGAVVVMAGKAGDNVAVRTVYYSLNGSGWLAAATVNGWTNWAAGLTLAAGTNTVQAYAVDTGGNVSTTNTVQVNDVVLVEAVSTNNVSPAAAAILESPAYSKSGYAFDVTGTSGRLYVVEASSDLVHWAPVATNTAPFTFMDSDADRFSQRFYRSVYVP
jgi:predicted secreted protein